MSSPCHSELFLLEKEDPMKKEVRKRVKRSESRWGRWGFNARKRPCRQRRTAVAVDTILEQAFIEVRAGTRWSPRSAVWSASSVRKITCDHLQSCCTRTRLFSFLTTTSKATSKQEAMVSHIPRGSFFWRFFDGGDATKYHLERYMFVCCYKINMITYIDIPKLLYFIILIS